MKTAKPRPRYLLAMCLAEAIALSHHTFGYPSVEDAKATRCQFQGVMRERMKIYLAESIGKVQVVEEGVL